MENKAVLELINASQDALLGNNGVLAYKILEGVKKVVDGTPEVKAEPEKEKPDVNPLIALHNKPKDVYPELKERVGKSGKKQEPEIVVVENKVLPENEKVLDKVNEKAKKLGMDLAEKEVEVHEDDLSPEEQAEADAESDEALAELGTAKNTSPEVVVVEEEITPEKQAAMDKVEKKGETMKQSNEENK